jgi:6-phosphofructokinase 1
VYFRLPPMNDLASHDKDADNTGALGIASVPSPLRLSPKYGEGTPSFVSDGTRVLIHIEIDEKNPPRCEESFEKAGPRAQLFFQPHETRVAILTAGGLCPGLNNVIRSAFLELYHNYGVKEVWGIRYGFAGLDPSNGFEPVRLSEDLVDAINNDGGTLLGSSRGIVDPRVMVDFLVARQFNIVLTVGGDGTTRGAMALVEEIQRRNLPIAVVGIPKTIDNDIPYVDPSFGFSTAVARARDVLESAHAEAKGAPYGIGLVKIMGREAGFIAAGATLASQQVNFCLIPEHPLILDGERGFLAILRQRMLTRNHAVIALAEGAGQELFDGAPREVDASGNVKLHDIGQLLRDRILTYFAAQGPKVNLKYFEPSYYIRSVPANATDALLCDRFARNAVHAAMAGKTGLVIGYWNNQFVHVPMKLIVGKKRRVPLDGDLWRSVLATTGQPCTFG